MQSVIIAAPSVYDSKLQERLEHIGTVDIGADGIFVFEVGNTRVYIGRDDALGDDLEPETLERVKSLIPQPLFYYVDFSDIRLCRRVLEAVADDPELVVYNDVDVVLKGTDFVHLLRERPGWNWLLGY